MAMSAATFFTHFKKLNAYMRDNRGVSAELDKEFSDLTAAFRKAYSPDAFRQAIGEKSEIDSDLEERVTSVLILFNKERATKG